MRANNMAIKLNKIIKKTKQNRNKTKNNDIMGRKENQTIKEKTVT